MISLFKKRKLVAQNDICFEVRSCHGTVFKNGKKYTINLSFLLWVPEKSLIKDASGVGRSLKSP